MAQQLTLVAGKPGEEDLLLEMEADTAAYFGHLGKSEDFSLRAADSADHAQEKETAATYTARSALRSALFGRAADARKGAAFALSRFAGYKDFLTLWKDADPDIPILKQAKAEYVKLQ